MTSSDVPRVTSSDVPRVKPRDMPGVKHMGFYYEEQMSPDTCELAMKILEEQKLHIPEHILKDFSSNPKLVVADDVHEESNDHHVWSSSCLNALFNVMAEDGINGKCVCSLLYHIGGYSSDLVSKIPIGKMCRND